MPSYFFKFCAVGFFNTAANYLIFLAALRYTSFTYLVCGVLGYLTGSYTGYFLNRLWTFNSNNPFVSGFLKYQGIQLFCMLINLVVQYVSVVNVGISKEWSQLPGIIFTTFVNYHLSRFYVFNLRG